MKDLEPTKSCADKFSGPGKKWAHETEKKFVEVYEKVMKKHGKVLENLKVGGEKVLKNARQLFDEVFIK